MPNDDTVYISLESIVPWDNDHLKFNKDGFICRPFASLQTSKHRATIDLMKICILEGHEIRPILVYQVADDKFQRLDGFCRYWAYKELGINTIPCEKGTKLGGQGGMNPFIS